MEQLRMIHKLKELPEYHLAEGFSLRMYQPGDEAAWTDIHGVEMLDDDGNPTGVIL